MPELFRDAKLKVKRAKKHINDLNAMVTAFITGKHHEVFIEHDVHGGDDMLKVKAISSLPEEFSMILGDAIHNLRTALDFVINEIEFLTLGKMTKFTKFPFYATHQALVGAVGGGFKQKAPKQVIDCIVDIIQPYITGDCEALLGLNSMDLADKHQLLLTKTEFNFISGICFKDDAGIEKPLDTWLLISGKVAWVRLPGCKNAQVTNNGNAAYKIFFDHPQTFASHPFAQQEVIPVVRNLARLVEYAMSEIESAYILSTIYNVR